MGRIILSGQDTQSTNLLPGSRRPRVLFLVPTTYEDLHRKGVADTILDKDEGGFFERVVTVHPFAPCEKIIPLSDVHVVYELKDFTGRIPLVRNIRHLLNLWRVLRQLKRLIDAEGIDLVRANDPYYMGMLALLLKRARPHLKICVSIHADYDQRFELDRVGGAPSLFRSRRLAVWLERMVLRRMPMVMPIRESLAVYAVKHGARRDAIRVIPHGIDISMFSRPPQMNLRDEFGIPRERKILSFAGRLSRENYVDDVVALARQLRDKRDDFVIVMAGVGSEAARLDRLVAAEPRLRDVLRLVGPLPREKIATLRASSAVSLCLMGGFSLIEACAAGRPVAAYDVEWHHELVIDSETGVLVCESDVLGLVDRIGQLLDNPAEADRMGHRAQQLAITRHSASVARAAKIRCYRELLAGGPEGGARQVENGHAAHRV